MIRAAVYILSVFAVLLVAQPVLAEKRVALVIGNSAYEHTAPLPNPKNDAKDLTVVLKRLGFEVLGGTDLTRAKFVGSVVAFSRKLRSADVGLFFYAGHGLQVGGQNYLVPIDAELKDEADLQFAMVKLNDVLAQMERSKKTNLIFIDACRDNPLARSLARAMGRTRSASIGRGLAPVETGIGTMITFATQPGNVALDGDDNNSPFTTALLRHIETPNLDIALMLRKVRSDVIKATHNAQVPWGHTSLTDSFYFNAGQSVASVRPENNRPSIRPEQKTQVRNGPNKCVIIGRKIPSRIKLSVGMRFCDAGGRNEARVIKIANRAVVFLDNGGLKTCSQGTLCAFDWPVKPLFRIKARADKAKGIAPQATMEPR